MNNTRYYGVIKQFFQKKGFGYIACGNVHGKIFFHYTDVVSYVYYRIAVDQIVSFSLSESEKGFKASNIIIEKGDNIMKNYTTNSIINDNCTGRIKWYNNKKGFGFITIKDDENDVFFHYSEVDDYSRSLELNEGDEVSFSLLQTENGYHANHVKKK